MAKPPTIPKSVAHKLVYLFNRNGYVRQQDKKRWKAEGTSNYKKGSEVRLLVKTEDELAELQELLARAHFVFGTPFYKGAQYCQPIYGKQQVERFLSMVAAAGTTPSRRQQK